jgi:hypothetical protein
LYGLSLYIFVKLNFAVCIWLEEKYEKEFMQTKTSSFQQGKPKIKNQRKIICFI